HTRFSRDWSSDVCSSDLIHIVLVANVKSGTCTDRVEVNLRTRFDTAVARELSQVVRRADGITCSNFHRIVQTTYTAMLLRNVNRSEERRVGKEGSTSGVA